MRALGVAIWGLGPHALRNLLPAVRETSGLALRGVCSRDAEVVARAAADAGCAGWTDPAAMLADPAVEAVYLSTPIGLHAEQGRAVLAAGKHLWCEKPLAANAGDAAELAEASRARGVTLGEGFMYLYHPHFAALAERVRSGRLGSVLSLTCRFGVPPLERPGFRAFPELGGGAFLDVGCYPVSLACALFPGAEPEVRFAALEFAPGSAVDTAGRAVLRLAGGVAALLEWRTRAAYRNEVDLWGTLGSLSTERAFSKPADYVPRFRVLDANGRERFEEGAAANHFVEMLTAFRARVDDPAGAECEREAVVRRARVMDRIRRESPREE